MGLLYRHDKLLLPAMVAGAAIFWIGLTLLLFTLAAHPYPELSVVYPATLVAVLSIVAYAARHFRCAGQVAYLYGHAALINARQHPEIHARLVAVCKRLKLESVPTAFVWHHRHDHYYFSVRLSRRKYLALHSKLLDALAEHPGALDFFIGYELGRLHDRPTRWAPLLFPATLLPLIGPAYARARIYAYDRYGLAACKTKTDAVAALAWLASGDQHWKSFNTAQFMAQGRVGRHFWMCLLELTSATPWLNRRTARLQALVSGETAFLTLRQPLAYAVALFVPYVAPRAWGGLTRTVYAVLWVTVLLYLGVTAYRGLAQVGAVETLESRFENKAIDLPPLAAATEDDDAPANANMHTDLYARLDADLKVLGSIALERHKKLGGIPCEIGNIAALNLNYRANRYAFSCDAALVYTVIEANEFEIGRGTYLRSYNWKDAKFTPASAEPSTGENH